MLPKCPETHETQGGRKKQPLPLLPNDRKDSKIKGIGLASLCSKEQNQINYEWDE